MTAGAHLRAWRDELLHRVHVRRIEAEWRRRHKRVFSEHPEYEAPLDEGVERAHCEFWGSLGGPPCLDTLRLCGAVSGRADPRIVPEEVFAARIERCLGPPEWTAPLSHKSLTPLLLAGGLFPDTVLHCIEGELFDDDGAPVAPTSLPTLLADLDFPLVIKPNTGSAGGRGVSFPASRHDLETEMSRRHNFVVQRVLDQHDDLSAFNSKGINTVRVYTYRSVVTGQTVVLNAALRMGRGGSLDNETAGGLVCYVGPDGRLNHYAVDKYAGTFDRHPDTGIVFADAKPIPGIGELWNTAVELASRLPMMRLAGWDFCLGQSGKWTCLEVNLAWHTIRFAQYAGEPFFGPFSEEVRDFCAGHPLSRRAVWRVM